MTNFNNKISTDKRVSNQDAEATASRQQAIETAKLAANVLDDKKGLEIKVLKLPTQAVIADCFVIASGTSSTHIKALSHEVEFQLSEQKSLLPDHIEGFGNSSWILLDYGAVVIHIFTKESRDFYNLERLWSDAEEIDFQN